MATKTQTQTQTQADQMKRAGKRMYEIVNSRKLDAMSEVYASNVTWHGPSDRKLSGLPAFKEMVNGYLTAFPDLRMTVEHQVAEGQLLATEWRARGTHNGPMGDIKPTGRKIDIRGHSISRFEKGKVAEEFEVFDELAMLTQIGAIKQ